MRHCSRQPGVPSGHVTDALAFDEVKLVRQFDQIKISKQLPLAQRAQIEEAKPGRNTGTETAFRILEQHYDFGSDRGPTHHRATGIPPNDEDYEPMTSIQGLLLRSSKNMLRRVATRLKRCQAWKLSGLKSEKTGTITQRMSNMHLLYWCRCDAQRRFQELHGRLSAAVLEPCVNEPAGEFKAPTT